MTPAIIKEALRTARDKHGVHAEPQLICRTACEILRPDDPESIERQVIRVWNHTFEIWGAC